MLQFFGLIDWIYYQNDIFNRGRRLFREKSKQISCKTKNTNQTFSRISLERTSQMLFFRFLSRKLQKQLLDRWPFCRLPPGSSGKQKHFSSAHRGVCFGGKWEHLSWFKCARLAWRLVFSLYSDDDVCPYLPVVCAVLFRLSARCCGLICSKWRSRRSTKVNLSTSHTARSRTKQPFGLFTGGARVSVWYQAKSHFKHTVGLK